MIIEQFIFRFRFVCCVSRFDISFVHNFLSTRNGTHAHIMYAPKKKRLKCTETYEEGEEKKKKQIVCIDELSLCIKLFEFVCMFVIHRFRF